MDFFSYQLKKVLSYGISGNRLLRFLLPFQGPPGLLISYPRSGSSWIGELLNHSCDIAYLREPVNQPFIPYSTCIVPDPAEDPETFKIFKKLADDAFSGTPPTAFREHFMQMGVNDILCFLRKKKMCLIKDVNPLATQLYVEQYQPMVLILMRHPAAVAESFNRMGWRTCSWEHFGFEYGSAMKLAATAAEKGPSKTIFYEDVAHHPEETLRSCYDFLNVATPKNLDQIIRRFCHQEAGPERSPYETKRNSSIEVRKWKQNLTPDQISDIMKGYKRSGAGHYS
jgi:hypothetical protein